MNAMLDNLRALQKKKEVVGELMERRERRMDHIDLDEFVVWNGGRKGKGHIQSIPMVNR